MTRRPLCIDLFTGLHGWAEAFIEAGYRVVGFDLVDMRREIGLPPLDGDFQLVLQDVLTLHGSQFARADCIVASPPCQRYSYMAMPWSRAKAMAAEIRADESGEKLRDLNALFDACFRIQREASEAAGHHIPLIVENVRGAQPWVGPSRYNYGSFYLWGDVPALMPRTWNGRKVVNNYSLHGSWKSADGLDWRDPVNVGLKVAAMAGVKVSGQDWNRFKQNGEVSPHWRMQSDGIKQGGSGAEWWREPLEARRRAATAIKNGKDWFGSGENCSLQRRASSRSTSRKAASALIAKIPFPLARHIAEVYKP